MLKKGDDRKGSLRSWGLRENHDTSFCHISAILRHALWKHVFLCHMQAHPSRKMYVYINKYIYIYIYWRNIGNRNKNLQDLQPQFLVTSSLCCDGAVTSCCQRVTHPSHVVPPDLPRKYWSDTEPLRDGSLVLAVFFWSQKKRRSQSIWRWGTFCLSFLLKGQFGSVPMKKYWIWIIIVAPMDLVYKFPSYHE